MKKEIKIDGMHCEHCVKRIDSALSEIDGVKVKVSLKKGSAEIKSDNKIPDSLIKEKIENLGFTVTSIN